MRSGMTQLNLSARAYHRILKLARTIADLTGSEEIQSTHLAEALHASQSTEDHDGISKVCNADMGVISMYALQLASNSPGALVDWNNNYADDPDRCVLFHCGNRAKSFIPDIEIKTAPILGTTLGEENTYGAMAGRALAGPMTYARVSTDDPAASSAAIPARANWPTIRWTPLGIAPLSIHQVCKTAGIPLQKRFRTSCSHDHDPRRACIDRGVFHIYEMGCLSSSIISA
jgi:hypothetical protein